ncbi:Tll0287-like domain-containing protein [Nitratifractor sp.]
MKKSLVLFSMIAIGALMASEAQSASPTGRQMPAEVKEGVGYIKMLGKELKGNLKKYLKKDPSGLQAAYFCAKSAERLTKEVNAKYPENVRVYRTALKLRNPKNAPDATDRKVMEEMEKQMKEGTFKKKPVVVEVNGAKRIYVPLMVEKACLKCHGPVEKIDPKVRETIAKHYPEDKAVGFKEGDLRGVIVAEITEKKK